MQSQFCTYAKISSNLFCSLVFLVILQQIKTCSSDRILNILSLPKLNYFGSIFSSLDLNLFWRTLPITLAWIPRVLLHNSDQCQNRISWSQLTFDNLEFPVNSAKEQDYIYLNITSNLKRHWKWHFLYFIFYKALFFIASRIKCSAEKWWIWKKIEMLVGYIDNLRIKIVSKYVLVILQMKKCFQIRI